MNFVDEEDVAFLQVGQDPRDACGLVYHRAARGFDAGAHFLGDDVGKRRLSEARRPREQDVVERLSPLKRGRHKDAEIILDLLLADKLIQTGRPENLLEVFF